MSTVMRGLGADDFLAYEVDRPKTYPRGRRCAHEGCATVLSVYNPDEFCGAHLPEPDPLEYHGYRFKHCLDCGEIIRARATYCKRCESKHRDKSGLLRKCRYCGQELPETAEHWSYIGKLHVAIGTCKSCERARKRENGRKRYLAAKTRRVVVFPHKVIEMEMK